MLATVSPIGLIETHVGNLQDPRASHGILHKLLDILIIKICAVICEADNFVAIAVYGKEKEEWLKTFLELANGIPSVDTFERLFARLKSEALQKSVISWTELAYPFDGE